MENIALVIVPAGTIVTINGTPCRLPVDAIVETAWGNMRNLKGHHYGSLPAPPPGEPAEAPRTGEGRG